MDLLTVHKLVNVKYIYIYMKIYFDKGKRIKLAVHYRVIRHETRLE